MDGASIYILRCADASYYAGVTRRSVDERVSEHAQGLDEGCYTFRRRPVTLVHAEHYVRIADAGRPSVASRGGRERRRKPISAPIMPRSLRSQSGAENERRRTNDPRWICPSRPLRVASGRELGGAANKAASAHHPHQRRHLRGDPARRTLEVVAPLSPDTTRSWPRLRTAINRPSTAFCDRQARR